MFHSYVMLLVMCLLCARYSIRNIPYIILPNLHNNFANEHYCQLLQMMKPRLRKVKQRAAQGYTPRTSELAFKSQTWLSPNHCAGSCSSSFDTFNSSYTASLWPFFHSYISISDPAGKEYLLITTHVIRLGKPRWSLDYSPHFKVHIRNHSYKISVAV